MTTHDPNDIEKILLSLTPKAAPSGLKARVLESALKKQQGLVMTPWKWAATSACAALIAIAVLGDAAVSRAQNERLYALLNGSGVSRVTEELAGPIPAEIYKEIDGLEKSGRELTILTRGRTGSATAQDSFEARERLKGWFDHEDEGAESLN
jgi:hypothetical protein